MSVIEGSSVLITGGGSGIGEAIARYFVELGALVTVCGRREEKIDAVAGELG
jgi:3-oxoacyl-[acyl-carrier protein] reductase